MELVEGPTLADRITQGSIPLEEALIIAKQIADALEAAHDRGVVHRDLKPANIKLRPDGTVKVLDFGLAKVLTADGSGTVASPLSNSPTITSPAMMTGVGIILGTAPYMSPEQATGRPADKRSDTWAFGCVLYEMLTGARAFPGDDVSDTLAAVLRGEPDWRTLPAGTPVSIRRLLRRCLEKDPKRRLADAADARLEIDDALLSPGPDAQTDAPPRRPRRELVAWSLLAIVSALAAILGWIALDRTAPTEERTVRATMLLPDNWSSLGINPSSRMAVSPDGRRLAFAARGPDRRTMLWVRNLDSSTAHALQGTEGAVLPFWSPDSMSLGFFAAGKLKKIDAAGGLAVTLCDAPTNPGEAPLGGTWNRDGVILFASAGAGLQRVSASGGTPVTVTTLRSQEDAHQLPFFLPDGQHFLYRVMTGTSGTVRAGTEIRVGSLVSTEIRTLLKGVSPAIYAQGHLLFGRDESLMAQAFDPQRLEVSGEPVPLAQQVLSPSGYSAFSASENGVLVYQDATIASPSRLVWVDRHGKELVTLGEEALYADVQLASDGKRAVVSLPLADNNSRDIWIFDLTRGFPTRFTFDAADEFTAIWSPDDGRVVFNSRRGGRLNLFEKASTMVGDETLLLADSDDKFPLSWSPDGRFILYSASGSGEEGLWILPLFGDRKPFPFARSTFSETSGQFSPDGKWIAYRSTESGRPEIWAAPFPGPGKRTQISTGGASYPRWRRDGRELYYVDADARLIAAQVNAEASELQVAAVRPLFDSRAKLILRYPYDVSADGQRFLINRVSGQESPGPITLVVNWPALLKK
jgi:serine/threonine protein kinase